MSFLTECRSDASRDLPDYFRDWLAKVRVWTGWAASSDTHGWTLCPAWSRCRGSRSVRIWRRPGVVQRAVGGSGCSLWSRCTAPWRLWRPRSQECNFVNKEKRILSFFFINFTVKNYFFRFLRIYFAFVCTRNV